MNHFKQQDWVDFVRGVLEPGCAANIESHLADGCQRCRATVSGWQAIVSLASRVGRPGPPADVVSSVKAAYLVQAPRPLEDAVQFATLSFDSFFAPALAGVRSASPGARHLVYQSGNCTIEFHIGACLEVSKAFLAGQIADSSQHMLGTYEIKLVRNGHVTAQAIANSFGEFTLEFTNDESLWLLVESPKRRPIAVPLRIQSRS